MTMQWQPIETAPKDGTRFLAYEKKFKPQHYECWWFAGHSWQGWMEHSDDDAGPTHWMPLPEPPQP